MEIGDKELITRSELVKEHLITIALCKTLPNENDRQEFIKFLTKVGYVYFSISALKRSLPLIFFRMFHLPISIQQISVISATF